MKVRELLQFEIWSKSTSRRIFKGFGFIVLGLVVGIVGLAGLGYVSGHWLTGGERVAAKSALSLIDSVPLQYSEVDQKDFAAKLQRAQQAIEASRQAAKTGRDMAVYSDLSSYLLKVDLDRKALRNYTEWQQRPMDQAKSNYLRFISSEVEARRTMSANLHRALDK